MTTPKKPARYRAAAGINWPDGKGGERRAEAGDVLTAADLKTAKDLRGLVAIGAVEPLEGDDEDGG